MTFLLKNPSWLCRLGPVSGADLGVNQKTKMAKYLLEHDRPNCIGCGACVAVNPKHWVMNEDGKSDIINGRHREDGLQELEIGEEDLESNKAAADSCPVNVIHLKNKETEEKII